MCKHAHIFASVNVCVCHKLWASVHVYILVKMSVCFRAAGQGGLVSLWIDAAAQARLLMG